MIATSDIIRDSVAKNSFIGDFLDTNKTSFRKFRIVISVGPNGTSTHPTHDANGNTLSGESIPAFDSSWTYVWNDENRLVTATKTDDTKLEFLYDGLGRRKIKKTYTWSGSDWTLDKTINFVYDGWNLIAELDENNLPTRTYTWGIDLSGSEQGAGGVGGLLKVSDGSDYYPSYDGNGNITSYVDSSGAKVDEVVYSPFGKIVSGSLSVCPFGFSSKYVDDESGLVYYGYRYYDSGNGRWLNRDPLGEGWDWSLYSFCLNNPDRYIDVLGMWHFECYIESYNRSIGKTKYKGAILRDPKIVVGENEFCEVVSRSFSIKVDYQSSDGSWGKPNSFVKWPRNGAWGRFPTKSYIRMKFTIIATVKYKDFAEGDCCKDEVEEDSRTRTINIDINTELDGVEDDSKPSIDKYPLPNTGVK